MRARAWVAMVAVGASALAACGGGGGSNATPTPEKLATVLLTPSDLGAGWTETQRGTFTAREPENPSIDPSLWCPDGAAGAEPLVGLAGEAGADAEMEYDAGDGSYRGIRQQAWSNGEAATYYRTVNAVVEQCRGKTWTGEGTGEVTFETLTAPAVGDEAISFVVTARLQAPDGDTLWTARHVVARDGNTIMVLQGNEVRPADRPAPETTPPWSTITDLAGKKLAGLSTAKG